MQSQTLTGALVKIYINGKPYGPAQSIDLSSDFGQTGIYGIDSLFVQEISPTRAVVAGTVSGLRIKSSGGLEALGIAPTLDRVLEFPYISIRIQDRQSKEDIWYIQAAQVTNQRFSASSKGVAKVTFSFLGVAALSPLDRVNR